MTNGKDKQSISEYIKEEFLNESEAAEFTDETPLISSRIMDSISTLQLVDFLEKEFEVEFNHHEVEEENLDTVNKIWEFIKSKKE